MRLTDEGLEALLLKINIEIHSDTATDYIVYCPFHLNRNSPALNVSKSTPYPFRCWNTACGEKGTLVRLIMKQMDCDILQAMRMMQKYRAPAEGLVDQLKALKEKKEEPYKIMSEDILEKVKVDYGTEIEKLSTLTERAFTVSTLANFKIGFSSRKQRITIPIYDEEGAFVGISGRAVSQDVEPRYWDPGVPKRHVLFNLNSARANNSGEVIVVEGPLDAMKVWQAGYPNVVAFMGGGFSKTHAEKLTKYFSEVTIFTDNDEPGRAHLEKIASVCRKRGKKVNVVEYKVDKNDPGAMSDKEIQQALDDKISYLNYKIKTIGGN